MYEHLVIACLGCGGSGYKRHKGIMKIESVRIQNFRLFKDETINLNDYTAFVGPNGCGKSTVFNALNILFQSGEKFLNLEDFHHKESKNPIIITVTFCELSPDAQEDFSDYYRQGKLIISVVGSLDESTQKIQVKQYGERLGIRDFSEFFKADGDKAKVEELKPIYDKIRGKYTDLLDEKTKPKMIAALREFESKNFIMHELISSEDEFYGISKGKNLLEKYIQWVYIPAVKDAVLEQTESKNTALSKLLNRTVRQKTKFDDDVKKLRDSTQTEYEKLLKEQQGALESLSSSLGSKLSLWAHPNAKLRLEWSHDPDKSIKIDEPYAQIIAGEGSFEGELSRFGHGFQRIYLFILLQELAFSGLSDGPRLILACEEPELFQHPPQARHLSNILNKLSHDGTQTLICTHSPYFIPVDGFENVRMLSKIKEKTIVSSLIYADLEELIAQAMSEKPKKPPARVAKLSQILRPGLNEMFFTTNLILVEGSEDLAFITTYIDLLELWDQYRLYGCHIVPVQTKSNLIQPLAIAKLLNIPTYTIFDSDSHVQEHRKEIHRKDNKTLLNLAGYGQLATFPAEPVIENSLAMWPTEIADVVKREIPNWDEYSTQAEDKYGHAGNLQKNSLFIATVLNIAWDNGQKSESLQKLCFSIINFSKNNAIYTQKELVNN